MSSIPGNSNPKKWHPLESNPESLNKYLTKLNGDSPTSLLQFNDLLSTEDWAIGMLPQPIHSLIFLYNLSDIQVAASNKEDETVTTDEDKTPPSDLYYMKQDISNACGTIALLHSIGNLDDETKNSLNGESWLQSFLNSSSGKTPEEIAALLQDDGFIENAHESATSDTSNATANPDLAEKVNLHFVAFVPGSDGSVWELDGRRPRPFYRGDYKNSEVEGERFVDVACKAIKGYMERDPTELNFTLIALTGAAAADGGD